MEIEHKKIFIKRDWSDLSDQLELNDSMSNIHYHAKQRVIIIRDRYNTLDKLITINTDLRDTMILSILNKFYLSYDIKFNDQ